MKRLLLLISLAVSAALSAVAQNSELTLPARLIYKRVADGLSAGTYALSGTNEKGHEMFLTSNFYTDKTKLLGKALTTNDGCITVDDASLLWKIEVTEKGTYKLLSVKEQKYLKLKTEKTGLEFDSKGTEWYASFTEDGNVILRTDKESNRQLAVAFNYMKEISYFDNYTSSADKNVLLGLKVYQPTFSQLTGPNTSPANDSRLCLGSRSYFRQSDGSLASLSNALLRDGTLAPSDDLPIYTAVVSGNGTFALKGESGFLDYNLQETPSECLWQITNGHICTTENAVRYLCFQNNSWTVCDEETAQADAWLYAVAEEPQFTADAQGVYVLTGGWSASRLAAFTADGVRCLDLTQLVLPQNPKSFSALPANVPIFVSSEYKDYIPQAWRFAVACGNENVMTNVMQYTLTDRTPFFTDRRIKVSTSQLKYRRTDMPTDKWQTLSLPFAAKIESGRAFAYKGRNEDGTLQFEETTTVEANTGYIILPSALGIFSAESKEGYVECKEGTTEFKGTNNTLTIAQSSFPIYLLHPTEQCFRQAAAGSTLPPFRAYFQTSGARSLRIRMKGL